MERKLYQVMASTAAAYQNCISANNEIWKEKHLERLKGYLHELPHGSGIDSDWWIDEKKSNGERLVFGNAFHNMNDCGMYDGWTPFVCIVTGNLASGFNLRITGAFPRKYADTREYLVETIGDALDSHYQE